MNTFTAKVEVRPKIDSVHTDALEVWQKPIEVADELVNAEVEGMRHQHAEIQVPDPMRPAQEGDLLTLDGSTGKVYTGALDVVASATVDELRELGVRMADRATLDVVAVQQSIMVRLRQR